MVYFTFEEQSALNQIITKDKSYEEVVNDLENIEYQDDLIKEVLASLVIKFKKLTKEEFEYIKNNPFILPFDIEEDDEENKY